MFMGQVTFIQLIGSSCSSPELSDSKGQLKETTVDLIDF